jgi:hypothetical protein
MDLERERNAEELDRQTKKLQRELKRYRAAAERARAESRRYVGPYELAKLEGELAVWHDVLRSLRRLVVADSGRPKLRRAAALPARDIRRLVAWTQRQLDEAESARRKAERELIDARAHQAGEE